MVDIYRYGEQDPIPFKITIGGVGKDVQFNSQDVMLYLIPHGTMFDITPDCTAVDPINLPGLYLWTPVSSVHTSAQRLAINIRDTLGYGFDQNFFDFTAGGDPYAGLNGA